MPYLIRPVTREELPETVTIYLDCVRGDFSFKPQAYFKALNPEDNLAGVESWLYGSGAPNQMFVAVDGAEMVGYIAVGPFNGGPMRYDCEVGGLFVRPRFRSLGIGLMLLRAGLEYLHNLGFRNVILHSLRKSKANSYYQSLDGKRVSQEQDLLYGMELESDIFGWDIQDFLSTVNKRLKKYGGWTQI